MEDVKDYPALIIDIRENGGGNSTYLSDFLMPLIVDRKYSQSTYSVVKGGLLLNKFRRQSGLKKLTNSKKLDFDFPQKINTMLKDFSYYSNSTMEVGPSRESINFKDNLSLLFDKYMYIVSQKNWLHLLRSQKWQS